MTYDGATVETTKARQPQAVLYCRAGDTRTSGAGHAKLIHSCIHKYCMTNPCNCRKVKPTQVQWILQAYLLYRLECCSEQLKCCCEAELIQIVWDLDGSRTVQVTIHQRGQQEWTPLDGACASGSIDRLVSRARCHSSIFTVLPLQHARAANER
jgi:hypothetical protein